MMDYEKKARNSEGFSGRKEGATECPTKQESRESKNSTKNRSRRESSLPWGLSVQGLKKAAIRDFKAGRWIQSLGWAFDRNKRAARNFKEHVFMCLESTTVMSAGLGNRT